MNNKLINFSAGPTKLPAEVLKRAQAELLSFNECGVSVLEMSHRSAEFTKINNEAEVKLRQLVDIPDNYKILFLQGGASAQFSAIPLNLMKRGTKHVADYVVTGSWSALAALEASKYGTVHEVFPRLRSFVEIPPQDTWSLDPEASYIYYCANETVHGVEFYETINNINNVPVVCDMSSCILSRELPISKYGLIYASAQKNLGCAGVTIVIVREDLLAYADPMTPIVWNYKVQSGMNSLYNTPPTFAIYITNLMLEWMIKEGGLKMISERNDVKATLLHEYLDESGGFYISTVKRGFRSRINVVFRIKSGDENLERGLVTFAKDKYNIMEIKGHRSVGGLRVSLYNVVTAQEVEVLIQCLEEFRQQYLEK